MNTDEKRILFLSVCICAPSVAHQNLFEEEIMRTTTRGSSRVRGFSLIELLLVLVILSVLAAIIVPRFTGVSEKSRKTKAETEIAYISTALKRYEVEVGRFPSTDDGL